MKKEEKVKHRRSLWCPFVSERKEDVKEKGRKRNKSPGRNRFVLKSGRWLFIFLISMQNWFCVGAAAGRSEERGLPKDAMLKSAHVENVHQRDDSDLEGAGFGVSE